MQWCQTCLVHFDHLVVAGIVQADGVVSARSQKGVAIAGECEAFDFAAFLVVSNFVDNLESGRVDDKHTPVVCGGEDVGVQRSPNHIEKLSTHFVCEDRNGVRGQLIRIGGKRENLDSCHVA